MKEMQVLKWFQVQLKSLVKKNGEEIKMSSAFCFMLQYKILPAAWRKNKASLKTGQLT